MYIPVADAVVGDSPGASGASLGVSLVEPSVAGSLEGPFVGRMSVKPSSAASLGLFTTLPVLVPIWHLNILAAFILSRPVKF